MELTSFLFFAHIFCLNALFASGIAVRLQAVTATPAPRDDKQASRLRDHAISFAPLLHIAAHSAGIGSARTRRRARYLCRVGRRGIVVCSIGGRITRAPALSWRAPNNGAMFINSGRAVKITRSARALDRAHMLTAIGR
jgi:hypothetical protein